MSAVAVPAVACPRGGARATSTSSSSRACVARRVRSSPALASTSVRSSRRGGAVRRGASSSNDDATRKVYRDMGVGADEDEFGTPSAGDPSAAATTEGSPAAMVEINAFADGGSIGERRALRDASNEPTNDVAARFLNLLKYILVVRLGTEMPMRMYDVGDAGGDVGANVFSKFLSGLVPAEAASAGVGGLSLDFGLGLGTGTLFATEPITPGIPFFHVGIGPYIGASIAMQVMVAVVPSLKELTKDPIGQQTVKQYTRYLTFVVAIFQSILTANELRPYYVGGPLSGYFWHAVPAFICGAIVVTWLADEMTNYGLGNGTSMLITMSVCGAYFKAASYYLTSYFGSIAIAQFMPWVLAAVALTAGSVLVQTGTCKVPLLYFQGPSIPGLPRVVRSEIDHIPFKVNPLGMQPVLVAVFLCEGMTWLAGVMNTPGWYQAACAFLFSHASWFYYVTFFLIVFGFSYLDLQDTPKEVSEYMVKIGARVPNVRPGEKTIEYLGELQSGSRFFGGILLGAVAVACAFMDNLMRARFGTSVGFTSMLIVTSTILQMKRQIAALGQMPKLDKVIDSL